MRPFMGFFADMPNQQIYLRDDAFRVDTPKLRNRLLSSMATMLSDDALISIDHLVQLIESSSKLNHNLVKSDILPKDRQNYSSCEKISDEAALGGLISIANSRATRIYL
ncbi:unnamed protein product [Rotaria sp. Silwood1]|nr:unnamed protein product [Rotaria sp. Silwood1]